MNSRSSFLDFLSKFTIYKYLSTCYGQSESTLSFEKLISKLGMDLNWPVIPIHWGIWNQYHINCPLTLTWKGKYRNMIIYSDIWQNSVVPFIRHFRGVKSLKIAQRTNVYKSTIKEFAWLCIAKINVYCFLFTMPTFQNHGNPVTEKNIDFRQLLPLLLSH